MHQLDDNEDAKAYFLRQNKNGKAAYRQACRDLTGALPIWAVTTRTKVATLDKVTTDSTVTTQAKVTTLDAVVTKAEVATDPLANISAEELARSMGTT